MLFHFLMHIDQRLFPIPFSPLKPAPNTFQPTFSTLGFQGKFELQNHRTPGYPLFLYLLLKHNTSFLANPYSSACSHFGNGRYRGVFILSLYRKIHRASAGSIFLGQCIASGSGVWTYVDLTDSLYAFLVMLFMWSFLWCSENPGNTRLVGRRDYCGGSHPDPAGRMGAFDHGRDHAAGSFLREKQMWRAGLFIFLPLIILMGSYFR